MNNVTNHGYKRLRERSSKSIRQNELALERGLSHEDFSGSFRRYLDKIRLKENYYTKIIVYANKIFIYNKNEDLITVLNIPSKYLKYLRKK